MPDVQWFVAMLRHGCAFAQLLLVLRILHTRIAGQYRFLLAFCLFSLARYAVMSNLDKRSPAYLTTWTAGDVTSTLLLCAVIWEVFSLTERSCGPGKSGKIAFVICSAIALGVGYWLNDTGNVFRTRVFAATFFKAYMSTACAAVMILTGSFYRFVPVQLPRNLEVHRWLITLYCLAYSASYVTLNLQLRPAVPIVGLVTLLAATCVYGAYAALLRRDGQAVDPMPTAQETARANRTHEQIMSVLERAADRR